MLKRHGIRRTVAMIGRMLADRQRRPVRQPRPSAGRQPTDHPVDQPGDLVQRDTLHLTPLPGVARRQGSASAVDSGDGGRGVRATATAGAARAFLVERHARLPCPRTAGPVAGGCAGRAAGAAAGQDHGSARVGWPPRSLPRTGRVERTTGTRRRAGWARAADDRDRPPAPAARRAWDDARHHVQPHHAVGRRTPRRVRRRRAAGSGVAPAPNEDTALTISSIDQIL